MPHHQSKFDRRGEVAAAGELLEELEPRVCLSAPVAHMVSTTVTPTEWRLVVSYAADAGVDLSSIGDGDIVVTAPERPAPTPQPAFTGVGRLWMQPIVQGDGTVLAVYSVTARGQAWDWADTGTYSVFVHDGHVRSTTGEAVAGRGIGQYWLWFTTPRVDYVSGAITNGSICLFSVTYSDDNGLDLSSIGDGDLEVYGPGGPGAQIAVATVIHRESPGDGTQTIYYQAKVAQVSSSWLNRGTYDIVMRASQVSDAAGNSMPAFGMAQFWYWSDQPAAELVSSAITDSQWQVSVRYSSFAGIDLSTIGDRDIGYNPASSGVAFTYATLSGTPTVDADGSVVASYLLAAPSGGWDRTEGSYTLSLMVHQVYDTRGASVTTGYLIVGAGSTLPQESTWSAPAAAVMGSTRVDASTWDVTVQFTDPDGLDSTTLLSGRALSVRGVANRAGDYGGFHSILSVTSSTQDNPTTWTVTYRLSAPAGSAGFASGRYYLRTGLVQIQDAAGHLMPSEELLALDL